MSGRCGTCDGGSGLFLENPINKAVEFYPGLESAAGMLVSATGLSEFAAGNILIGGLHALLAGALFLFYERVTDSPQGRAARGDDLRRQPGLRLLRLLFRLRVLRAAACGIGDRSGGALRADVPPHRLRATRESPSPSASRSSSLITPPPGCWPVYCSCSEPVPPGSGAGRGASRSDWSPGIRNRRGGRRLARSSWRHTPSPTSGRPSPRAPMRSAASPAATPSTAQLFYRSTEPFYEKYGSYLAVFAARRRLRLRGADADAARGDPARAPDHADDHRRRPLLPLAADRLPDLQQRRHPRMGVCLHRSGAAGRGGAQRSTARQAAASQGRRRGGGLRHLPRGGGQPHQPPAGAPRAV